MALRDFWPRVFRVFIRRVNGVSFEAKNYLLAIRYFFSEQEYVLPLLHPRAWSRVRGGSRGGSDLPFDGESIATDGQRDPPFPLALCARIGAADIVDDPTDSHVPTEDASSSSSSSSSSSCSSLLDFFDPDTRQVKEIGIKGIIFRRFRGNLTWDVHQGLLDRVPVQPGCVLRHTHGHMA